MKDTRSFATTGGSPDQPLSRRRFAGHIAAATAAALRLTPGGVLFAQAGPSTPGPLVTSLDLSLIDDWLTPTELFFVREHFPAPRMQIGDAIVSVTGAVQRPMEIRYEELLLRPRIDLPVVLECAGNPVGGGMLGNAEWNGARLGPLLGEAGTLPEAKYVRLVGADGEPGEAGRYSRSIPIEKTLHPDTLLAYGMNGEILTTHHGFPVRAIVPGWYGMDSVKWLRRIEVLTEPDKSPIMTQRYLREVRQDDGTVISGPVTGIQIKSAFTRPLDGAVVYGRRLPIRGIAWAGVNRVSTVEVSTDGGVSWNRAEMGVARPYSWVQWKYDWTIPGPATYQLAVRAIDDRGIAQPAERPSTRRDVHELNHYERVKCTAV